MWRRIGVFAHLDPRPFGEPAEDLVVAVVRAAEADVLAGGVPAHDGAVVHHLAVLVAERAVGDLSRLELGHVARHDPVHEVQRTRAVEVDLPQHREVHQACGLAHRAVLLVRVGHVQRGEVAE